MKTKKGGEKGSVALVQNVKQFRCVFQNGEPPKVRSILRKGTNSLETKEAGSLCARCSTVRNNSVEKPSLGVLQPTHPHERNFFVPNF